MPGHVTGEYMRIYALRTWLTAATLLISGVFLAIGVVVAERLTMILLGVLLVAMVAMGTWWGAGVMIRSLDDSDEREELARQRERQFASDASHELRTPLTGLRTRIEVTLADPSGSDAWQTLREALADSERLQAIMDDLLALSKLDAGAPCDDHSVDLAELARTVLAKTVVRVPVKTDLAPRLAVPGDRLQLTRLLTSLLTNAERHAVSKVAVVVARVDGHAVVEVSDDGAGIASADRERVFQRFTRLDTARSRGSGGTGLGLALAREIAAAHNGHLAIEDPLNGQGARFVLHLPLLPQDQHR
jgi:signal transduction histidine kinase